MRQMIGTCVNFDGRSMLRLGFRSSERVLYNNFCWSDSRSKNVGSGMLNTRMCIHTYMGASKGPL